MARGFYISIHRQGKHEDVGPLSLSIGIVSTEVHTFHSLAELASLSSAVKHAAKAQEGSAIVRARRLNTYP